MISRFLRVATTVAIGLSFVAGAQAAAFINVLTGGTSGIYYPMGVALSQVYGKAIPDVKASVQSTKASAENLNLLQAGRGEVGFTLGDALSDAWKGNAEIGFPQKLDKLRAIGGPFAVLTTVRVISPERMFVEFDRILVKFFLAHFQPFCTLCHAADRQKTHYNDH